MISLFDSHCDTVSYLVGGSRYNAGDSSGNLIRNDRHIDLYRAKTYGRYAQYFALFTNMYPDRFSHCKTQEEYIAALRTETNVHAAPEVQAHFYKMYAAFLRQMAADAAMVSFCRTADDLDAALAAGKCAGILMVEGAEQLENIPVDTVYRLGIRAVTLTWNYRNWVGGSNLTGGGLTEAGRQFVRDLQSRGILVDLSHGGEELFWDVYKITQAPLIASHSNARALCYHPRNLTDEQFCAICRTGGLAGYNFCQAFTSTAPTYSLEDAADHIQHFLSLGGAKHIGMGGDLDGIGELPEGVEGIQDVGKLADVLARRRIAPGVIEDILFGNQYRLAKECWK